MRFFLLLFLSLWVLGCILGVVEVSHRWLIVFVLVVGLVIWHLKRNRQEVTTIVILVLLGYIYGFPSIQAELSACNFNVTEEGVVIERPELKTNQVSAVVKVKNCLILVSAIPFLEIRHRDEIKLSGGAIQTLEDIKDYSPRYADYLARRGIGYTWRYPDVKIKNTNTSDGRRVYTQVQKLHITLRNRVQKLFIEPDASIVLAMLLAQKGQIPEDITQSFRATGVSHILAISGLHIAIITSLILAVVSWFPLKPWWRTGLVASFLWVYVFFIGFPMSAIRAASFISVALLFLRLSKLASLPTALVLTVATVVTIKPQVVLDVGFQLSVSAVFGIFLTLFLGGKISILPKKKQLLTGIYRLLLVSLGATLFTAPLIAYHFGTVSLIGLVTNLLVVPIVPLLLWIVILTITSSFLWMPGALALSYIAHILLQWLIFITQKLSTLPGIYFKDVTISIKVVIIYYLLIGLAAIFILRKQRRNWREVWG